MSYALAGTVRSTRSSRVTRAYARALPRLLLSSLLTAGACAREVGSIAGSARALQADLRIRGDAPGAEFTWIAAIAVASDGTMYTLHPAEGRVLVWSAAGQPIGSFAGPGQGPGELLHPEDLGWLRDSIWVSDPGAGRFNVYDRAGHFDLAIRPGAPRPAGSTFPLRPIAPLFDGSLLSATSVPASVDALGGGERRPLVRLTREGTILDTVATLPARRTVLAVHDPDAPDSVALYTFQPYPDAPLFGISRADSSLVIVLREVPGGTTDSIPARVLKIDLLHSDTLFARTLRFRARAEDTAAVHAFVRTWAERAMRSSGPRPGSRREAERWVRAGLRKPVAPAAIDALGTGRDGSIWLLRGSDMEPHTARVLDAGGRDLWTVQLPSEVRLLAADTTCVWGTYADSAGVPWLLRYRILR